MKRLEAINISKIFTKASREKSDFYAVKNMSFSANEGEILGILGPNGAGKTTLLRMLCSIMEPTSGEVVLYTKDGEKLTGELSIKQNIGYMSNNTKLYPRMTCREILKMMADLYGISKEDFKLRLDELTEALNLADFLDIRVEKLSTGQNQRCSIARCMLHKPPVYVLDEPTNGLDVISSKNILEFMKKEKEKGKTIIYSSHYMEEAEFLCDRIIMMQHGQIIAEGTPDELKQQTGTTNLRDTFFAYQTE